jgi:WD40 repeat protein
MQSVDAPDANPKRKREHPNPFPGLRPFRSEEHHLFFGREEQTAALLQLLRTNRFLAVVGTSGSGKSSLVRAGMIAELHGGTMTQAGSTWEVIILRPGGSPIENLARAMVDADLYDRDDPSTLPRLLATLNRSRFGLVEAMKQSEVSEPGTNLLVVVDQFEELFRFRQQGVDSEETAAAFVNLLLTASEQAECPIYVTITMRSDYLGECSEIPGLAEAVNKGEYLIPRLLRDQKRDAIEKPIGVGGAKISPLLVQRLLNEVGDDPDQLPVLQHALMRMWNAWSASSDHNRPIDLGDFEATGGLASALSHHADEIYDSLPGDRHRSACEKIFKTLTVKGDDNRGIRRPTRLAQLQAIAASDKETVTTVLDAFRRSGVTFLMPGPEVELVDRTVIDLSHESLMRGWQRLRGWVEEESQSARIFRRLLDTARLWRDGKAGLFRDPDLQIALSWRKQETPNSEWAEQYGGHFETAIGFLDTSNKEADAERQAREAARQRELAQAQELAESRQQRLLQQQRSARKLRTMIAGLAAVAVVAGLACVAALVAQSEASRLAQVADAEADRARKNEEKARRNAMRAERSQKETANALAIVESQKAKAEAAERSARAAEEQGRKLLYTTDMQLVPFIWKDPQSTGAQLRSRLNAHVLRQDQRRSGKKDLRGFEWYYYQHLLENNATIFSGYDVSVVDATFTPNGQVVTLDRKGRVRRWYLESQDEAKASRRDLPGGASAQVRVLSPNGRLAALAAGDRVQVFDTSTGKANCSVDSAASNPYRHLIFSRDGTRLVIVDDKIRWVSAVTGEVIASFDRKFDRVESIALSADGLTLAVLGHNSGFGYSILRLNATARKVTPVAGGSNGSPDPFSVCALSPDGKRLAIGEKQRGSLHGIVTAPFRYNTWHGSAHTGPVLAIDFSGDGTKVATADAEGTIKIWDALKLTSNNTVQQPTRRIQKYEIEPALLTLKGHQGAINSIHFSSDGEQLVTSGVDKTVRVWDLKHAGAAIRPLEQAGWSNIARLSPDGQLIVDVWEYGRQVILWDAATGRRVRALSTGGRGVVRAAFSPTDNRLLAIGYGRQEGVSSVALWDVDTGEVLALLPGATEGVHALAFSPDGKYLAAGFGPPDPVKVWEVATRRLIHRPKGHTGYCLSLDFSKDGALLASGGGDGRSILWSTRTWKAKQTLLNPDQSYVRDTAFSPDGKILALATQSGGVQLWDVATGELLAKLKGHSGPVSTVVFALDGRTLVSGSYDQTVRLWNVATRRELMQLDSGSVDLGSVFRLAFSPDGKHLLAGGWSSAIWSAAPSVWNDSDQAAELLRRLLNSKADFRSRIRMFSKNLRIHAALAKLNSKEVRVQAALAATRANWHASRREWRDAAAAFDRLVAADPTAPEAWLRTPGLLRLALALLRQNRPADAARLLQGGATRRFADGLPPVVPQVGVGFAYSAVDGAVRVTELLPGFLGSRAGLLPGDIIVKVNDTELTRQSIPKLGELLAGMAGTKVRLTVRHSGSEKPEIIELTRERFVNDPATGAQLYPLRTAVHKQLAQKPRDAGLLELRAELAGQEQEPDIAGQVADYTAAIKILAQQQAGAVPAQLRRLYRRRGDEYIRLQKWPEAVDDYNHVVTPETTDALLLSNRARAHEALKKWAAAAADWSRAATGNPEGAKLLAEFARRLAASGLVSLANATRTKARRLFQKKLAKEPENSAAALELAQLLLDAGRTREAVPYLAKASAASPHDTLLSLRVAAFQAWFGQDKELAVTRRRVLEFARENNDAVTAERAAKGCSIRSSTNEAELETALALGRTAAKVGNGGMWNLLALGMAEHRSGNYAAAEKALLAAAEAGKNMPQVTGVSAFLRAMSLFRQGKRDEARKLAITAAAKMKPLPRDEKNPLAGQADHDDLILWLLYKEAKALIKFDAAPPPKGEDSKK